MASLDLNTVDIIQFLNLENKLSAQEIDDLLTLLTKEIWYRILNEELPRLLSSEELSSLRTKVGSDNEINNVLKTLKDEYKSVDINKIFEQTANQVKKEYIVTYLKDLYANTKDEEEKKLIEKKLELWKEQ